MGGMVPRTDLRLLGDNMAEEVVNVDLTNGNLHGLTEPTLKQDFTSYPGPVERAYYFPNPNGSDFTWLPLPSKYSSVVRSPLANDDLGRIYYTSPGQQYVKWNTYAGVAAGTAPYDLGIVQPTTAPTITSTTGGDTTVPKITRVYLYTYINGFGEESAPSPASNDFDGPPDATWHVSGFPTAVPANPAGANYPAINKFRIYRTVTSATAGSQFYMVGDVGLPNSTGGVFNDNIPDTQVVDNLVLESQAFNNPPPYLDGLVSMQGGMLLGFTNNTVHFCEPDRPHTWPSIYDQSVHYDIVAMAVLQQYLVVLTKGYPSTGSGNSPSNFILVQSQVSEPCIARGSVVVDLGGIYYASQNGLIQTTGYSYVNATQGMVEKDMWLNDYHARDIVACRHRTYYLAINNTNSAFIIDYAEQRLGFENLNTFQDAVCIWNDEYEGNTYICANKKIYLWDDVTAHLLVYRWRSKRFFTPLPISLGAVQLTISPFIRDNCYHGPYTLSNGDSTLTLPTGINVVFNYYAGPDYQLIMSHNCTKPQEIFRLPSGFKAFDHQCEIVGCVTVYNIQLATTLEELKGV